MKIIQYKNKAKVNLVQTYTKFLIGIYRKSTIMKIKGLSTFDEFINESRRRTKNANNGKSDSSTIQQYELAANEFNRFDDGSGNYLGAMLDKMLLLICRNELKLINIDRYSYTIQTNEDNYNKLLSFSKYHK